MKINYDEMTVEDGGILYKLMDLSKLSRVYERLCTAEYLFDNQETYGIKLDNMEMAYNVADYIRDEVENICECESIVIEEWLDEIVERVQEER